MLLGFIYPPEVRIKIKESLIPEPKIVKKQNAFVSYRNALPASKILSESHCLSRSKILHFAFTAQSHAVYKILYQLRFQIEIIGLKMFLSI